MAEARPLPEADLLLLNALADGELDAPTAAALERRMADEPILRKNYDAIVATREALGRLERPEIDADFLGRIESAVGVSGRGTASVRRTSSRWRADWRALAASVLVAIFAAGSGGYWLGTNIVSQDVADLVASSHRRSLLAASPVDIASSSRHTVKPWLDSRIGVSPPAPDLAAKGFVLVGGRVDVIRGHAVPTLVYRHNEHLITMVAEPAGAEMSKPADREADGYNMVNWRGNGFDYWAISDLERPELDDFVARYIAASETGKK
ncbi:MAG TPA: anti-sigma factor [Rhizobiaceae bacterium]|nr:anti-sigma factor [Rhizobiaceae bacterium]